MISSPTSSPCSTTKVSSVAIDAAFANPAYIYIKKTIFFLQKVRCDYLKFVKLGDILKDSSSNRWFQFRNKIPLELKKYFWL